MPVLARGLGFVGRAGELAALGALLEDALAGLGRLAVIRGEAGIGKTRLASELAARAEAAGAAVLVGRAWEEGSAPSGWPFVEALRAAREAPRLEGARAAIDDALEALRAPGAAGERFAALDRVARAFATAAAEAPPPRGARRSALGGRHHP
ncbi:MAG: ATP-binding protein, partial [Sandaracinaceae bacterium]|nr:ATP-binding protein [Sandaracinaceae bacterium]